MKIKSLISALLVISLVFTIAFSLYTPAVSAFDGKLRFDSDGKFKILQISDIQDRIHET